MRIDSVVYVDIRNDNRPISKLLWYLEKGIIHDVDRNDLIWDITKQSEFIEHCLMGIPIQPLYFHEQRDGKYVVTDGIQRLITLDQFRKNEFVLSGLTINQNLNNISFDGLSDRYRNRFDDFYIRLYYINPSTPKNIVDELKRKINNIY